MDYAKPRADLMPGMKVEHHTVACRTNPLGVKGTGEAGTTAAPPAVMNAIIDALPKGTRLDMPATSERVWRALRSIETKTTIEEGNSLRHFNLHRTGDDLPVLHFTREPGLRVRKRVVRRDIEVLLAKFFGRFGRLQRLSHDLE